MPLPAYDFAANDALTTSPAAVTGASLALAQGGSPTAVEQMRFGLVFSGAGVLPGDELTGRVIDDATDKVFLELLHTVRGTEGQPAANTTPDTSGFHRTGTVKGTPTLAVGGGMAFDGVNNGANTEGADCGEAGFDADPAHGLTLEVDFTRARTGVQESPASKWGDGSNGSYIPYFNASDKFAAAAFDADSNLVTAAGTTSVGSGTRHKIALVFTGTAMLQYLDGVRETSTPCTGPRDGAAKFWIGRDESAGDNYNAFAGTIHAVRVSDYARYTGASYDDSPALSPDYGTTAFYALDRIAGGDPGADIEIDSAWVDVPAAMSARFEVANLTAARGTLNSLSVTGRLAPRASEYAVSSPAALIARVPASWESGDVANPDPIFDDAGNFLGLQYSGYDATEKWGMGIAEGVSYTGPFTKSANNPLMSPADFGDTYIVSNGTLVEIAGVWNHFYQVNGAGGMHRATSATLDGAYAAQGNVMPARAGQFDSFIVADFCVRADADQRLGAGHVVTYLGSDGGDRVLAAAVSDDGGLSWRSRRQLLSARDYAANYLGEPDFFFEPGDGTLHVYHDHDDGGDALGRFIGEAVYSSDRQTVTLRRQRIAPGGTGKTQQVFDAAPVLVGTTLHCYFAGADTEAPAEGMESDVYLYSTGFVPAFADSGYEEPSGSPADFLRPRFLSSPFLSPAFVK